MPYDVNHMWSGNSWYYGASLGAYERLGAELGYTLIGTDSSGVNAFFVRGDLAASTRFPRKTAAESYLRSRLSPTVLWEKPRTRSGEPIDERG